MKEAKSAKETLIAYVQALTPAQAEKLFDKIALLHQFAEMHSKELRALEKVICGGAGHEEAGCVVH